MAKTRLADRLVHQEIRTWPIPQIESIYAISCNYFRSLPILHFNVEALMSLFLIKKLTILRYYVRIKNCAGLQNIQFFISCRIILIGYGRQFSVLDK